MDYNKNNFNNQDNGNQGLPEGIFGNEEQFRAYAPEHTAESMQHPAENVNHAAENRQQTTDQVQHVVDNMPQVAEGIPQTADTTQQSTDAMQGNMEDTTQDVFYSSFQGQEREAADPYSFGSTHQSTDFYTSDSYYSQSEDSFQSETGTANQAGAAENAENHTAAGYGMGSQASSDTSGMGNGYYGSSLDNQYYQNSYHSDTNFVPGGGSGSRKKKEKKAGKKNRALKVTAAVMAGVLLISGAAGGGIYVGQRLAAVSGTERQISEDNSQNHDRAMIGEQKESEQQMIGSTEQPSGVEATATMTDVSAVVENVTPAIVAINCNAEYVTNFWGQQYVQPSQGSGSGIIIGQNKDEVLIVTNNHVVATGQNARNESIEVVFGDESSAEATIKGTEEGSDLAVVSVKLSELTQETLDYIKIATLGDSDTLKVGEMAIAIGNALGYGQSTTVGWISALDREIATEDYTMSLIQTDAAINPGNSGGALLNVRGEVIGINSAKYSDESVEGMGFAIPISKAIPIINDLMNREEIPEEEQAYLGIVGQDVPEAYHERYGMPFGIYVYQVTQGSPAQQAGLNMGDIITAFNDREVSSMEDLQRILAAYRGGEEITLTIQVFEEGKYTEKLLHVTLGYKSQQN